MSLLNETVAVALTILAALLSIQALWLLCRALWPGRVAKAAQRCEKRPVLSFILGTGVTVVVLFGAGVVAQAGPPGQLAWLIIVSIFAIYTMTGVAGLATLIGQRLASPVDDLRPWRTTLRGGMTLALAYLIPIPGWLLLPLSFVVGAGAITLSFFDRRRRSASTEQPPIEPAFADRLAREEFPSRQEVLR